MYSSHWRPNLSTSNRKYIHPSSPDVLAANFPRRVVNCHRKFASVNTKSYSEVSNRTKNNDHSLHLTKLFNSSCPHGKLLEEPATRWFRWSFAPYPNNTNDLHVILATSLHQHFLCLQVHISTHSRSLRLHVQSASKLHSVLRTCIALHSLHFPKNVTLGVLTTRAGLQVTDGTLVCFGNLPQRVCICTHTVVAPPGFPY